MVELVAEVSPRLLDVQNCLEDGAAFAEDKLIACSILNFLCLLMKSSVDKRYFLGLEVRPTKNTQYAVHNITLCNTYTHLALSTFSSNIFFFTSSSSSLPHLSTSLFLRIVVSSTTLSPLSSFPPYTSYQPSSSSTPVRRCAGYCAAWTSTYPSWPSNSCSSCVSPPRPCPAP